MYSVHKFASRKQSRAVTTNIHFHLRLLLRPSVRHNEIDSRQPTRADEEGRRRNKPSQQPLPSLANYSVLPLVHIHLRQKKQPSTTTSSAPSDYRSFSSKHIWYPTKHAYVLSSYCTRQCRAALLVHSLQVTYSSHYHRLPMQAEYSTSASKCSAALTLT
jgi:hypothetical protein